MINNLDYIKIIGYKAPYNVKINNTVISINKFIQIVQAALKNISTDYNSKYYVTKYTINNNLNQIDINSIYYRPLNKEDLYNTINNICYDLRSFGLSFK